ncbi:MAG: IPT/TIG domain-containing protein [Sphingobacteriaceae bacterium]|nr:IPT/TIG domain-containing protein [Sphingobacteriaceae bacterium]
MKKIHQTLLLLLSIFSIGVLYTSCSKDDQDAGGGEPLVKYVRVTKPESADSLLVGAGQGQLIAIIGENLKSATQIWFNDQQAVLTPTYITNTTIMVRVPATVPKELTNTMRIVFASGKVLQQSFELQISEPLISSMVSEYVPNGGVATIRGNFFYAPLKVTFTGGAEAEIVSLKDAEVQVIVPAGAQPGQITITTNFGETQSDFMFRDSRNIFISSDPFTGWWNESYVVTNPDADSPPKINGNYIRVKKVIGGWAWTEVAGGPATAMGNISKSIPDEAILKPEKYNLKFEVNTMKPYNNNALKINVGLQGENNNAYIWAPPYDTKGKWQTVVIPFDEIAKSYGAPMSVNPNGYWARLLFHGGGELDADISFDNFRVVPKDITN